MGSPNVRIIGADATANGGAKVNLLQVCAKPSKLFSLCIFNTGPDQYYQLHDSAATPAANAVPKLVIKVPADSQGFYDFPNGRLFASGIFIGNSTAAATYVAGAADSLIDADYCNPFVQ